jgi:hypothetical protein
MLLPCFSIGLRFGLLPGGANISVMVLTRLKGVVV